MEASEARNEDFNVQIVIDTTGSMSSTIQACSEALVSATGSLSQLGSVKMGLHTYVDYCDGPHPTYKRSEPTSDVAGLQDKIRENLKANGGGDEPEAVKTALNDVLNNVDTKLDLVLLLTDASPHCEWGAAMGQSNHYAAENKHIKEHYGDKGITDWFKLAREYEERGISVITFLLGSSAEVANNYYPILSSVSGGLVLKVTKTTAQAISEQIITFTKALAFGEDTSNLSLCEGIELLEHPREAELLDCVDEKEAMTKEILPKVEKGRVDTTKESGRMKCMVSKKATADVFEKVQELNSYVQMEHSSKMAYRKS
eukprot:CAMPEP_0115000590 /NCGR_PEP_ID=MMETSP0216-20121206/16853_1 /TAXON_ID=223996 /ORGANISM="Protocruzia adherens, Strain Boccale" /LENGTH=313 /DNA_ID=CAMNT_0002365727 /DNA_START=30 /DNA_END=967 /DNA_ORIENTATION=-